MVHQTKSAEQISELNAIIGENVRNYRKQKKLSQEDLAVLIMNHREYISRVERGLVDMRITSLVKIATCLQVSTDKLLCQRLT